MSDEKSATALAFHILVARRCGECQQVRKEKSYNEGGIGFGQVSRQKTMYVCGNSECPNNGNP